MNEIAPIVKEAQKQIEVLLPDRLKKDVVRYCSRAIFYLQSDSALASCSRESLRQVVLRCAEIGLSLDGNLAYAIPYKNQATLQIGWKGYIHLATRDGMVTAVEADVICENDEFHFRRTLQGDEFDHAYDPTKPRGKELASYAIVIEPNGHRSVTFFSDEEYQRVKSDTPSHRVWSSEMRKKCAVKRALKSYVGREPILMQAMDEDNSIYEDAGVTPSLGKPEKPELPRQSAAAALLSGGRVATESPAERGSASGVEQPSEESPSKESEEPARSPRPSVHYSALLHECQQLGVDVRDIEAGLSLAPTDEEFYDAIREVEVRIRAKREEEFV